jgi:glycosyltransferase involved in cell wall biosynthesis
LQKGVERKARSGSKNPPKVLRAIARLNIGGPARHAVVLDEGLRARGFDCVLVHGSPGLYEGSFEELLKQHSVRSVRIPGLGRRVDLWSDLVAFCSLVRILFEEKPDIIHTHTAKAGALGRTAALVFKLSRLQKRNSLIIHTFHGNVMSGYFGTLGSLMVRLVERSLALWTDRVVVISEQQREEIVERFRIVDASKVAVIPLGLELDDLLSQEPPDRTLREMFGWTEEHIVIGYVGRFVPIKDLSTLVFGFAQFLVREPRARLLLVGDGELRSTLENQVHSLGLDSKVGFTGWRRDLSRVYGAIDIAALTSLNEGTPVSLIEALAAGRPVVATAVGGVPDVIRHEQTGVLISPGDPSAFALALDHLVCDEDLRRRIVKQGRTEVARRFGSERLISDMATLYCSLLETQGAQMR